MQIAIRKSIESDLEIFFQNQTDDEANHMAAFTPKNPSDRSAYITKWSENLKKDSINMQSILVDDRVVGCVVKFVMEGDAEITYAIDKALWGQGVTTHALQKFLEIEKTRPIFGRVAFDNFASQKVLEKAGFIRIGEGKWFANARGKEIEEFIYQLA